MCLCTVSLRNRDISNKKDVTALLVSMQCFDIVWKSILTSVQIHKKAIQFKIQSLFFYNYYNKKRIMQYWHKRVLPISKKYTKKMKN